jgi:hypothetical protein
MLSEDAKTFMAAAISSIWALELLLFLRKRADRSWTVAELTRELRASDLIVEEATATFQVAGLLVTEADATLRYKPASDALEMIVAEIADAYATQPVAVSKEILSARHDKIRHFTDAFRIRKD